MQFHSKTLEQNRIEKDGSKLESYSVAILKLEKLLKGEFKIEHAFSFPQHYKQLLSRSWLKNSPKARGWQNLEVKKYPCLEIQFWNNYCSIRVSFWLKRWMWREILIIIKFYENRNSYTDSITDQLYWWRKGMTKKIYSDCARHFFSLTKSETKNQRQDLGKLDKVKSLVTQIVMWWVSAHF